MLDAESIRELVGRRKRLMPEIDAALAVIRAQGKRQGYRALTPGLGHVESSSCWRKRDDQDYGQEELLR